MFSKIRSLIFKVDPEIAHDLAIKSLKLNLTPNFFDENKDSPIFQTDLFGKKIDNVDEPYNLKYQIVDDKEKKVVYVDGTFDLLHPGHIDFFKRAKALGNYLIAGVLDDSCVESYKRTPIISLKERTTMLENLRLVDKVISPAPFYNSKFGNLTKEFLQKNEIDYVVYAGELGSWSCHYQAAIEMNIMTIFDYGKDNISTSEIIKRIQDR